MSVGRFLQQAAAGNAGEAVYVDDVFSTYLYTGNGGSQTITNGIDLAGEGGLVWGKPRNDASNHILLDTERYPTPPSTGGWLSSNSTAAESTSGIGSVTSWNSDGLGISGALDFAVHENVLWTFRKQAGFFDIVTWDGDGTGAGRVISHNLGSVPGMIIVKSYVHPSGVGNTDWRVYHRQLNGGTNPEQYGILLNGTGVESSRTWWNNTAPTSTQFTIGGGQDLNGSGGKYIAYIFAHDAQDFGTDSDESIIKCGSFSGTTTVDLGWEPQWLLVKASNPFGGNWWMVDTMRGMTADATVQYLAAESSSAEANQPNLLAPTATGFKSTGALGSQNFIYVAIRRPNKPASEFAATDLFDPVVGQTSGKPNYSSSTGVVDALFRSVKTSDSGYPLLASRLTSPNYLITHSTATEVAFPSSTTKFHFAMNDGWGDNIGGTSTNVFVYMFRRAPEFFDVVTYTGDGTSSHAISHNLGVTPELMIVKRRNASSSWYVWISSFAGTNDFLLLNSSNAKSSASTVFPSDPTSSNFTVGSSAGINNSNDTFIAYLFATVPGISKVGSYSGTGSDVNVNCGFTSGARFVMVKRSDSTGDWYVWDAENGIVAGNDPYKLLNSSAAQVTSTDYIDPLSSGFTITSSAPAALNTSGGTYIFLAIA